MNAKTPTPLSPPPNSAIAAPPPMRIAHIITRLILGGAQENTLLSCEDQFRDFGDSVTLITGPALGPEGSLMQRAAAAGFEIRVIDSMRRSIHPLRDWSAFRALKSLLRELAPDVVHTHSSKAGILGRAAAWQLGIPCVHTIHGPAFHAYQSSVAYHTFLAAEKWAARRCDKLISVCDAMTHQHVAAGVARPEKFVTVYSGMEVEPFVHPPRDRQTVRRELGFTDEHVVIGKVARLFHLKGHSDLITAAKPVVQACPNVRFLLVGDGLLKTQLQAEIAAAGLTDHFVFTGLVPPEKVPELIAAMDVVAHASYREGLARVLPQGLIAGKPVISYDVDGAREVCITGETGVLIPPQDIAGLSAAMLQLAADAELRQRLGATGRARFTDQFRHETMSRRLREIYAAAITARKPRPARS